MKKNKSLIILSSVLALTCLFSCNKQNGTGGNEDPNPTVDDVDKSSLKALIDEANTKYPESEKDNYEETTFESYLLALENAKKVYEDANATQTEVDDAYSELNLAMGNITLKTAVSLAEALAADYSSNFTIQGYEYSSSTEYNSLYTLGTYNDYVFTYSTDSYENYNYYFHDYNGENYQYFEKRSSYANSKSGWLKENSDGQSLSLKDVYFDYKVAFASIDTSKATKEGNVYYFNSADSKELGETFFGNYLTEDVINFYIEVSGNYISKVTGITYESAQLSTAVRGGVIEFTQNSVIDFSSFDFPEAPNENNVITWKDYSGEEIETNKVITGLALEDKVENQSHEIELGDTILFYLDIQSENTKFAQRTYPELVNSDSSIINVEYTDDDNSEDTKKVLRVDAKASGSASFYYTYQNIDAKGNPEGELIKSNTITITVKEIEGDSFDQNILYYSLEFNSITSNNDGINEEVSVSNVTNDTLPTILTGDLLDVYDTSNSDNQFDETKNVLILDAKGKSASFYDDGATTEARFDFEGQQVSHIAFNFGLYYDDDYQYLSDLTSFEILVRNSDDEEWSVDQDIAETVKAKVTYKYLTHVEISLNKVASQVAIRLKKSNSGNLRFGIQQMRFYSDENCTKLSIDDLTLKDLIINENYNVALDSTLKVNPTINPSRVGKDVTITYESSNKKIFTVSEDGVISTVAEGSATLKVTATQHVEGGKNIVITKEAKVNVYNAITTYSIPTSLSLTMNSKNPKVEVSFQEGLVSSNYDVKYTFTQLNGGTNNDVVSINEAGEITLKGTGKISYSLTKVEQYVKGTDTLIATLDINKSNTYTIEISVSYDALPDSVSGYYESEDSSGNKVSVWLKDDENLGQVIEVWYDGVIYSGVYYDYAYNETYFRDEFTYYTEDYNNKFIVYLYDSSVSFTSDITELADAMSLEFTKSSSGFVNTTLSADQNVELKITADVTAPTYQLNVKASGSNVSLKSYSYKSSDPTVASVDSNGLVTGLKEGSTTITISAVDNYSGETISCATTVLVTEETVTPPVSEEIIPSDYCGEFYDYEGNSYDFISALDEENYDSYYLEVIVTTNSITLVASTDGTFDDSDTLVTYECSDIVFDNGVATFTCNGAEVTFDLYNCIISVGSNEVTLS